MIRAFFLLLLSIIYLASFSQKIGDDANGIKLLVENEIRSYYNAQGYHQVRQDYKVLWNEGLIVEIILQKENVPDAYFRRPVSYRVRYIMRGGVLNRVIKEFYDIERVELEKYARDLHQGNRINEYLFSHDYSTYSRVYAGENGLASIIIKKTVISDFQPYLQKVLSERLAEAKKISSNENNLSEDNNTKPQVSKSQFVEVDKDAEFVGGRNALLDYLKKSIKYPKNAQQNEIGGDIEFLFTIDINGSVKDVEVLKGNEIGYGITEELKNALLSMPKWKPALLNGKAFTSKQELDITLIPPSTANNKKWSLEFTKKNKAIMPKRS
jgi:hypothetical protein